MSFAKYAALVKNLRGIILADVENSEVWYSIQWLIKRFRYRDLGLTPSMLKKYRDRLARYLGGNPFVELTAPVDAVNSFIGILSRVTQVDLEVVELLAYASAYISPAIAVGEKYLEQIKSLAIDAVYTCKDMDLSSWRLHLRIADYTVLDFYRRCVDEVLEMLAMDISSRAKGLADIARDRKARVLADKKRYWRIACESGRPFLYYVDMVSVVLSYGVLDLLELDHAACLAIVPVVIIPPGLRL